MSETLLTHFEVIGSSLLSAHPSLNGRWSIFRVDRRVEFSIPPLDEQDFEVGATCEEWGILPKAGPWEDVSWEPYQWSIEEASVRYSPGGSDLQVLADLSSQVVVDLGMSRDWHP